MFSGAGCSGGGYGYSMATGRSCANLTTFNSYNPNIFHEPHNVKDNRLHTEKLLNNKELLKSPGRLYTNFDLIDVLLMALFAQD